MPVVVPGVCAPLPVVGCATPLWIAPGCAVALPVPGAPGAAFGFTAAEPLPFGAGEGEFSVPSLPVVVPAPPVPEYAPVLSRAVPVPGPSVPAEPPLVVPGRGWVVPAVPVPIGAPAFPPTGPLLPTLPAPPVDCASAATGQTVAAPARMPVPTHRHAVRLMTVAFPH